jgi:hypothetical protein
MELPRTPTILCLTLLISVLLWFDVASLYQISRPHFDPGIAQFADGPAQVFTWPFHEKKVPKSKFALKEKISLSSFFPTIYSFYPQDALWAIKVNGHSISARGLPLSMTYHEGRSIDLAPFLHPGTNTLEFDMEAYWGEVSLYVYISPWDKFALILTLLVLLATSATGALFCSLFRIKVYRAELGVLLAAFLIRYLYVFATPWFTRSYDWWGHAAYLDFVAQNLSLPNSHADWETYQPPLYYFLLGGLTKLFLLGGMEPEQRYVLWQGFSLLCSFGVMLAGMWIARLLYPMQVGYRLYLLAVLGVAPALVFNASRVSNDVFLDLLEFIWLGSLLRFWKQANARSWMWLSLVVSLALVTKESGLVLVPVSLLCLLLVPDLGIRARLRLSLILAVGAIGISGWYYLGRALYENRLDSYVVGNIGHLNPKGHIDGVLIKSLIFNPFKVLRYPFVQPWGPRHEYFLEYFFKSIFLGEWFLGHAYRWVARAFILTALLLIPVFFRGLWFSVRHKVVDAVPLLITFIAVFVTHWIFVQIAPFMSSQDFRYSVILLVPMVYFLVQGASLLPLKGAEVFYFALQLLILNSAIYLLELTLEG